MDVDVPEAHAAILRTACGFSEEVELPAKMLAKYWEMKRICDRTSDRMSISDLKHIAYELGYGKPTDSEAHPTIVDLFRRGALKRDTPVVVSWRNGERNAVLKKVDGLGRVFVQMDGDPDERQIAADKVRVGELVAA
jgi:hypothetical protein